MSRQGRCGGAVVHRSQNEGGSDARFRFYSKPHSAEAPSIELCTGPLHLMTARLGQVCEIKPANPSGMRLLRAAKESRWEVDRRETVSAAAAKSEAHHLSDCRLHENHSDASGHCDKTCWASSNALAQHKFVLLGKPSLIIICWRRLTRRVIAPHKSLSHLLGRGESHANGQYRKSSCCDPALLEWERSSPSSLILEPRPVFLS